MPKKKNPMPLSEGDGVIKSSKKKTVFDKDARKEEKEAALTSPAVSTSGKTGEFVAMQNFKANGTHFKKGEVVSDDQVIKMLEGNDELILKL